MVDKFPAEWKLLPLEDCMAALIDYRGVTPKKSSFGIPLVTAKIIKNGRLLNVNEYIPTEDYDEWMRRGLPEPGDVLMTTEAPLGEIAQLDARKVALAQRVITLRGKPGLLDNTFLKFLMMSDFIQHQLKAHSTGTTVLGIKQSELRKVNLVIPPLNEQRAIAELLGSLDNKIELNKHMNTTLEALASGLFKAWFIDSEEVKGWNTGTLSEIAYFVKGVSYRSSELVDISNTALVTLKCMERGGGYREDGLKPFSGKYKPSQRVLPGEVVIAYTDLTQAADVVGRAARVEPNENHPILVASLDMVIVRPKEKPYSPEYLYSVLSRSEFADYAYSYTNGTTVLHLSSKALPEYPIKIPPEGKVEEYTNAVSPIYAQIDNNKGQSRTLAILRDTLLPRLMRGEIRVKVI
jgi:type I restriction enzyme, S subunit